MEPSEPPPTPEEIAENTRRSVRSTTEWLARGIDSWFGDKPFEQGGRVSDGRLSVSLLKREDESLNTRVGFSARFRLPNIEERTYLFIGRDNDREVVSDTPPALSRQDRLLPETPEERSFFAGIGVGLRDAFDLRLGFHGIKPYGQARYHRPWSLSERDQAEFRQTFFWRISDHFGSTTAFSYEHTYSPTLTVRWLSATTITQKTEKFEWSSILGAYKSFGDQRLLSLEFVVSGAQGTGMTVSEFGVQTKWLQPVHQDWLLAELVLGYFWPRHELSSERIEVWAVGAGLIMRF